MIRIIGVNIPDNKSVYISLSYIYGIGKVTSKKICNECNINYYIKVKNLSKDNLKLIRDRISKLILEGDLKRSVMLNIKRLIDINCYRGIRHKKNLPVNGQRTKTNAKTCKKKRRLANFKY